MTLDLSLAVFLVAISLFSAMSAVYLLARFNRPAKPVKRQSPGFSLAGIADRAIFLFAGTTLVDATPAALLFIDAPVDRDEVWKKLATLLEADFPGATGQLQALADQELEFELPGNGAQVLKGSVENNHVRIELCETLVTQNPISVERAALSHQFQELGMLREVSELSPLLIWRQAEDGKIVWANRTYLDVLAEIHPDTDPKAPPYQALFTADTPDQTKSNRQSLDLPDEGKPSWFEIRSFAQERDETLHFALHADPVVQAEDALRNFVQTLTMTFAHLPIGLAIFDKNRQLALFNPALADLTTLEPAWLTARPTLKAFLDRLRECRHVPEPKNYKTWRDRIEAVERAAEDGTYEENWPLPTGQTYRVTGRPHPEGAVAFLFEDITSAISLQRQFRSELELGQSVLDSLSGAIAVFSADGDLVMSNDQYVKTWDMDPREMLARLDINQAVDIWQTACQPNRIWDDLIAFVSNPRHRKPLQNNIRLKTGHNLQITIKPMARGTFICEFMPDATLSKRDTDLTEMLAQA